MRIYIAIIIFFWGLISFGHEGHKHAEPTQLSSLYGGTLVEASHNHHKSGKHDHVEACLLYTSPSPRDATLSRMPSSA